MKKRNEKKAVVCALCLGLTCSNLGMLNIHAVETKAPETVATKSDEIKETWVNVTEFSDEIIASTKDNVEYGETNFNDQGQMRVDNVKQVSISNTPITSLNDSLKGIDKLPNVLELDLNYSGLSGDITIPKMDNLTYLQIAYNSIKKLNLENLPKLKELYAQNNSDLESINLNSNTELTILDASYGNLKSLDLSNCLKLKELSVGHNPLAVLDISKNTDLEKLNVSNANSDKVLLRELILGDAYPALKDLNLFNNDVESIDFSKFTNAEKLKLDVRENKLKYVDLSGLNSNDKYVYLSKNNLIGYNLGEKWNGYISLGKQNNANIETDGNGEIKLSDYGLKAEDFKKITNVSGNCEYNSETGIFSKINDKKISYDFKDYAGPINVTLNVTHKRYENSWVKEPTIANYNILEKPQPSAEAKYDKDNVVFKYGKDENTFDYDEPDSVGTWYMKAYVYEGQYYKGLESKPIKFEVTKATGSVSITFKKEWSEGETPKKPEITSKTYDESQIHVAYRKKGSKETFDTIPTTAGTYELVVTCDENKFYYGQQITREFTIKKQTQEEINMVVNIGDRDYFSLSTLGIELTPENETEIKESLKGATYENGKFINITGNVVTFHYTLGSTICNYNLEIVRNSNQPVIVTMDIKAETDKDGNIYLKDLNLKNYKDEYASDIKYSCAGARFDNGKFYGFVNDKFEFAYNVNDKLAYQYRVTITKDNTVVEPDVKPDETKPVKPTKPADNKGDKDKPKDAVVKDTSETTQDHTAGLLMGMVTLAGAIIVTNKKHEKE